MFSLIVATYICVCTYFSRHNTTCIALHCYLYHYVFREDYTSPWRKIISLTLSITYLPVVGLTLHELSSVLVGMSVGVVGAQQRFRLSCWWDYMGIASDNIRRHSLTATFVIFCLLLPSHPFFHNVPWDLGAGDVLLIYQFGLDSTILCFDGLWFFYNGLPTIFFLSSN